jgi:fructose-bisphosphate aldolase class II
MDVVKAIHARLPNTHLVMHGSSSVPQVLQDVFNRFGGAMRETWGVPVAEIEEGIRFGVRKINIDTDCRLAMVGQFRKISAEKPEEFDPMAFLKPAMAALEALCIARFEAFGAAGMASKIAPISLSAMAQRYARETARKTTDHTAQAA